MQTNCYSKMVSIRLIIFDIDGTLYCSRKYEVELGKTIIELISKILGISFEEAKKRLEAEKKYSLTVSSSITKLGIDRRYFYSLLAERIEPSLFISPDTTLAEKIKSLRNRGLQVAAHTNSGTQLARKVLYAIGLCPEDFDILVTSDEAEPKPNPDGYILITQKLRIPPNEAVYIGDRPIVELRTAKTLGMTTILISSRGSRWADYTVPTIHEALELINKLTSNHSNRRS